MTTVQSPPSPPTAIRPKVVARTGLYAVLAASVFHFGELTIGQVKDALRADGQPVR